MTPEGKVKDWFAKQIKKRYPKAKKLRWPAGQYGTMGISDDILCINGLFIAVEAKADKTKHPTKIQAKFLKDVVDAGGLGLCLRGKDEQIFTKISHWLEGSVHWDLYDF